MYLKDVCCECLESCFCYALCVSEVLTLVLKIQILLLVKKDVLLHPKNEYVADILHPTYDTAICTLFSFMHLSWIICSIGREGSTQKGI